MNERCLRALLFVLLTACRAPEGFRVEADDYGPLKSVATVEDAGPPPTWPMARAALHLAPLPASAKKWRVLVDAGHGAKGNDGNTGLHCQRERDVTLELAFGLATRLSLMGPFEVRMAREGDAEPSYQERKAAADAWPADAVVSLHTDVRGNATPWITPSCTSYRNDDEPGFSVLWSREGTDPLIAKRQRLSWAVTDALGAAGFKAYDGVNYVGLYDRELDHPGSFINDKGHGKRIWFLRSLDVPTVIVETHHALDYEEVARWKEPYTRHVFANAIAKGLLDYFAMP